MFVSEWNGFAVESCRTIRDVPRARDGCAVRVCKQNIECVSVVWLMYHARGLGHVHRPIAIVWAAEHSLPILLNQPSMPSFGSISHRSPFTHVIFIRLSTRALAAPIRRPTMITQLLCKYIMWFIRTWCTDVVGDLVLWMSTVGCASVSSYVRI